MIVHLKESRTSYCSYVKVYDLTLDIFPFGHDNIAKATAIKDCRKHRRKCVKPSRDEPCVRCARLQYPCVSASDTESEETFEEDSLDGNNEMNAMWDQVQQMREIMSQLELQMQQTKLIGPNNLLPLSPASDVDTDTETETDSDSMSWSYMSAHPDYQWEISVVDGKFRLETPIQSVHEMLAYGRAAIRYLSPFRDLFQGTNLVFEVSQTQGQFMSLLLKMIAQSARAVAALPPPPRPKNLLESPRVVIDTLVDIYFSCQNQVLPFVDETSYMAHYAKVRDPTTCPITMAICVNVATSVCKHVPFNTAERRRIAEYFFEIAENLLYDIMDDPDRRLESIISIHLLCSFLRNTLRTAKSRKISSMALMICEDLSQNDNFASETEKVLHARHYFIAILIQRFLELVLERTDDERRTYILAEIAPVAVRPLPGDSPMAAKWLKIIHLTLDLMFTPCITTALRQICYMHLGQPGEFSLELLLQCEETSKKWWESLPEELRICEDPCASVETLTPKIMTCKDQTALVLFTIYQSALVGANGCLIQPKATPANADILPIFQERLFDASLRCSELVMIAIKRLEAMETVCHANNEFLFSVIETMNSLATSSNPNYVPRARDMLQRCIAELDRAHFMDGHRIPLSASPLKSSLGTAAAFKVYSEYPSPRYAMVYDILLNVVERTYITEI
ncbi:hypothetical protein EC973_005672 [Apophysomyces ossiformis]|uniref:Zn(2)-C6 fungal-type domain-containing protein n=1 Tax=Apophysomyces ossiformis TaxID=679940 RepID=A0A8H7BFW9_9FUNG|nr:hypothetical protein EC973_005672 [Apophysomyces ossiformis]